MNWNGGTAEAQLNSDSIFLWQDQMSACNLSPLISVIMSVYNGEKYLRESMDSILNQTFSDFEFIIINDGSTDKTRQILESYTDPRIRLFHQENIGLTKSLNKGIELARGEYIARQDADDVSMKDRLSKLISFFGTSPSPFGLATSSFYKIDHEGKITEQINLPTNPIHILWRLLFENPIVHSGVLFPKKIFCEVGGYNEDIPYAQDYDLWSRITDCYEIAIVKDPLVSWRETEGGICCRKKPEQRQIAINVSRNKGGKLGCLDDNWDLVRNFLVDGNYPDLPIRILVRKYHQILGAFCKATNVNSNFREQKKQELGDRLFVFAKKIASKGKKGLARRCLFFSLTLKPNILATGNGARYSAKIILGKKF